MEKFLQLLAAVQSRMVADKGERGATATEYALLVAFIALIIIVGVTAFGNALNGFFNTLATTVGGW